VGVEVDADRFTGPGGTSGFVVGAGARSPGSEERTSSLRYLIAVFATDLNVRAAGLRLARRVDRSMLRPQQTENRRVWWQG